MRNTNIHSEPELNLKGIPDTELKRTPMKVPDGYFADLTPRIMENVRASATRQETPRLNWRHILVPSFGIASIVLAAWFFMPSTKQADPDFDTVLASLTVEELVEYTELQPTELVSYGLVSYNEMSEEDDSFSQSDIIEYLSSEEDMELTTLMNEIEI